MSRPRLRWLSLAEIVAVAGVAIAGLSYWNGVADRRAAQADKAAEQAQVGAARSRLTLRGAVAKDHNAVTLSGAGGREITDVRVTFPTTLGIDAHDAPDDRILRDWVEKRLLGAVKGKQTGLLPVLVTYGWADEDGSTHHGGGIYDLVWRTHGGLPFGRTLDLTGFRLRASGGDQARLDTAWAREKPSDG